MNREIKFRAWDTKNKQFINHVPEKEYMIDSDCWDHHDLDEAGGLYPHSVFQHFSFNDRIIFQQNTTVHDKNKKEIYEGDKIAYRGRIGVVEFSAGIFFCCWDDQTDDELGYMMTDEMEIVGHIFE